MTKILIVGAFGYGNLGDEAIRDIELKIFSEFGEVKWDSPDMDREKVDWADVIVIGGGGLLYDSPPHRPWTGPDPHPNVENYMRYADEAIKHNKTLIFFCIGEQGIHHPYTVKRYREVLNQADHISVRDPEDAAILYSLGIDRDVLVAGDPAFLYTPRVFHSPEKIGAVPTMNSPLHPAYRKADELFTFSQRDDQNVLKVYRSAKMWTRSAQEFVDHATSWKAASSGRFHGIVLCMTAGVPVVFWRFGHGKVAKLARKYDWPYAIRKGESPVQKLEEILNDRAMAVRYTSHVVNTERRLVEGAIDDVRKILK